MRTRPWRGGRDHPRACGEQRSKSRTASSTKGSSPRVRGADAALREVGGYGGIIPARAGSRLPRWGFREGQWDHPRACGEQFPPIVPCWTVTGSSPRVRGAGFLSFDSRGLGGIIPARAGSSLAPRNLPCQARDHPRACGEQVESTMTGHESPGSSPRVRGAEALLDGPHVEPGIIPARAGSRTSASGRCICPGDHPRACGEQAVSDDVERDVTGSSPRVRGAVLIYETDDETLGIIPARAGSRRKRLDRPYRRRDHPRACGEQDGLTDRKHRRPGSSPRVRGAGYTKEKARKALGIIPARAGSRGSR